MSSLTSVQPSVSRTVLASESGDKLGDLVDKLDKVKVNGNEDEASIGAPEKYIKHPLQNAWTLWFFKNDKSRTWEENQRPIITVTTVEDFWSLYNHIEVASKLPVGADYSMFKEGIFPDWEDPRNQDGGRWIISLDKRQKQDLLDTYWLEIIFFLIGEHADQNAHQVNGAVVNIRGRTDKLAVWLADASQPDAIMSIGRMLKEKLKMSPSSTIGFSVHSDEKTAQRAGPSRQRFTV